MQASTSESAPVLRKTALQDLTDAQLIERAKSGEIPYVAAFEQLYARYKQHIVKVCRKYTRNSSEAHDLAQETFTAAWRALRQFRGDSKFSTWLYRIAVTRSLNYVSTKRHKNRRNEMELKEYALAREEDAGNNSSTSASERAVLGGEIGREVVCTFASMHAGTRACVILCDMEGMDPADVARVLEVPDTTVKSRLHKGRHALHKALIESGIAA